MALFLYGGVIMAINIAVKRRKKFYNGYMITADITLDNDYPDGGWEIKPSALGLSMFDMVLLEDTSDYVVKFDSANNKIRAFELDTTNDVLSELAEKASDLNNKVIRVIAIGY